MNNYAPPKITSSTSNLDAALTNVYRVTVNDSVFNFRGGFAQVHATNYYRFPVITLPDGATGNTGDSSKNANGWAVEFMSDASKVMVRIGCSTSTNGVQFEVDDYLVSATALTMPATSGDGYFLLDFSNVGGRKRRKIRLEGDTATGFYGVYVGPTSSVWSYETPRDIKVAFVGDSIEAQTGATTPNGGYAIKVGKALGWSNVFQVAMGGTGFVATGSHNSTFGDSFRVADVVAINPDVIFIGGSTNDSGTASATLRAAILATFRAYRTALPYVPIVVHSVWGGSSGPGAPYLAVEADTAAAFATWADSNSYFFPISNDPDGAWVFGTGKVGATNGSGNSDVYVSNDGVHPSPDGHDYYARRVAHAFRTKLLGVRA